MTAKITKAVEPVADTVGIDTTASSAKLEIRKIPRDETTGDQPHPQAQGWGVRLPVAMFLIAARAVNDWTGGLKHHPISLGTISKRLGVIAGH